MDELAVNFASNVSICLWIKAFKKFIFKLLSIDHASLIMKRRPLHKGCVNAFTRCFVNKT